MGRSMIGGWIYSKPVGWLVCVFADQSIGIMDGQWLVCRLVCSLFGMSVSRSNHSAGLYPTSHRLTGHHLTGHLNIYPPALDQPTKDTSSTSGECLNFRYRGSMYPRFRPAGWLRKGCLTHACKHWSCLRSGSSSLYWGYIHPRLDGHYPNRLT